MWIIISAVHLHCLVLVHCSDIALTISIVNNLNDYNREKERKIEYRFLRHSKMPLLSFREVLLSTFGFNYYWNAAIHAHFRSSFASYNIIRFKYRIIIQRMHYTQTHYKTTVSVLSFLVFSQGKIFYS